MDFSEKLIRLRRSAGLSQAELADLLGVTRQSVSKWESGTAMPELGKLIALSDRFQVSVDYLVKENLEEPAERCPPPAETARLEEKLDRLTEEYQRSWGPYFAYTSRAKIGRLPLVSVRLGRDRHPSRHTLAVGVIAVGNFSVGLVSVGLISAGGLSLGLVSFGLLALGMVAIGYAAAGLSVLGVYGLGVAVRASTLAIGAAASAGQAAVGLDASAAHTLLAGDGLSREAVDAFLTRYVPELPAWLRQLLGGLGA